MSEVASDFRLLHGHSLVGLWGALESMVFDLVAAWLQHIPGARAVDTVRGVKVSLADFDSMTPEDRMRAIVSELDRAHSQRGGIARFEKLLDAVALSGTYPGVLGENVFIVQQLRNVFAHRRGVADRRFVAAAPFFAIDVGRNVPCGRAVWHASLSTIIEYGLVIRNRVGAHFDQPPAELLDVPALRALVEPEAARHPR
jgi:hypothetical protein